MNKSNISTNNTNEIPLTKQEYDLNAAMNIPTYDETKYPRLNDTQMQEAGLFLYQLSLISSSVDRNMQNLLWHVYLQMSNYIKDTGRNTLEKRTEVLLKSLDNLKKYVRESKNPIFKSLAENLKEINKDA